MRSIVTDEPLRFPFDVQVRAAGEDAYPTKQQLLDYFREVREISKGRLAAAGESEFARQVEDPDFGMCTVLDIWAGVVTSFAWHSGQIALTAQLLPDTPVTTMTFDYWKTKRWQQDV